MVDFRMLGLGVRAAVVCLALGALAACNEATTPSAASALPVAGAPVTFNRP